MKISLFSILLLGLLSACSSTHQSRLTYTGPVLVYAVLPFEVSIEKKLQFAKSTPEMLRAQEKAESVQCQSAVYQYLMSHKKDYHVTFQDIDETGIMLRRKNLTYEKARNLTKAELTKILGVDGLLTGRFYRKESIDSNVGKALTAFAVKDASLGLVKADEATLSLTLYSAADKAVIWTYQNEDSMSLGSGGTPEDLTTLVMQRAARKFPFRN
jgi:hypothetical protein